MPGPQGRPVQLPRIPVGQDMKASLPPLGCNTLCPLREGTDGTGGRGGNAPVRGELSQGGRQGESLVLSARVFTLIAWT